MPTYPKMGWNRNFKVVVKEQAWYVRQGMLFDLAHLLAGVTL